MYRLVTETEVTTLVIIGQVITEIEATNLLSSLSLQSSVVLESNFELSSVIAGFS